MTTDYVRQFLSQESKAAAVYGEQENGRAFAENNRGVPFTSFAYARGISQWYFKNLRAMVRQLEGSPNSGRQIAGEALASKLLSIGDGSTQGGVFVAGVFPSSEMVRLGTQKAITARSDVSFEDFFTKTDKVRDAVMFIEPTPANLGIRDAMRTMGENSAKALVALETASAVINANGTKCLDPASSAQFWQSWRRYAAGANLAGLTPVEPDFWQGIKDEIAELPQEFKDAAEAAGGLAADALVFAGETAGRTAKGFFGSLGIVNGVIAGGAVWFGWKMGWVG